MSKKSYLNIKVPIIRNHSGIDSESFSFEFDPEECKWITEDMLLVDFIKGCVEKDIASISDPTNWASQENMSQC